MGPKAESQHTVAVSKAVNARKPSSDHSVMLDEGGVTEAKHSWGNAERVETVGTSFRGYPPVNRQEQRVVSFVRILAG